MNKWLRLGDSIFLFFYATLKSKITHNKINSLQSIDGFLLQSKEAIKEEILIFYKNLLSFVADWQPTINPSIMKEGYILTREQQLQLLELVSREEVNAALCGINDH